MHFATVIAVEADSKEDAKSILEERLEEFYQQVYDWYEIGGRWDGAFREDDEDEGVNVLCYKDNPELFKKSVEHSLKVREDSTRDALMRLFGIEKTLDEIPDITMGIPISDKKETLARVNESTQKTFQRLQNLLDRAKSRKPLKLEEELLGDMGFLFYGIGQTLMGGFQSDSYFYDIQDYSTAATCLWDRCAESPDKQFIVMVDMHN